MRSSNARWILFAACLLLCPLVASAQADPPETDRFWTTVGSTGTLDEDSEGEVFFNRAMVQKGTAVSTEKSLRRPQSEGSADITDSAVIRYNVTAVDGLFGVSGINMNVRYRDEGAQVTARLIEVDVQNGGETTLLTFDSNNFTADNGYHTDFVCDARVQLDFATKAYYIEATLTTSEIAAWSVAGIEAITLNATLCP